MNKVHYKKILDKIKKDPESWNQKEWHCGTSHCFAGHCQVEMGRFNVDYLLEDKEENYDKISYAREDNGDRVKLDAREYLKVSTLHSQWLFNPDRTISDFDKYYKHNGSFFNDKGFNIEGYNTKGFDHLGFDKNGFDKDGFDEYKFDKNNKRKKA